MRHARDLVAQTLEVLGQGRELLAQLDDESYARREPVVSEGGIGSHVRHCIDFYRSFLEGLERGEVDYDLRGRSASVETDRGLAAREWEGVVTALTALEGSFAAEDALRVRMERDARGAAGVASWSSSSVGRELRFLLSHTLHHYALIAVILRLAGRPVRDGFGVALSTLRHWEEA